MLFVQLNSSNVNYKPVNLFFIEKISSYFFKEIPKQTFRTGTILSAFITMLIFVLQLIHSIQNYKNLVRKADENYKQDSKVLEIYKKKNKTIQNAIRYPALILRYLFGGILICFHLLLFFWIFFQTLFTQTYLLQRAILISICSIICLYRSQKIITDIVRFLFTRFYSRNRDEVNIESPISILIYFDIISSELTICFFLFNFLVN